MIPTKMVNPGLLKITLFWNKGYDVTNKILSQDSNYIVDVFMLPKFGNSSISMREVINHNLNLIRIWPEKSLSSGVVLVQVQ